MKVYIYIKEHSVEVSKNPIETPCILSYERDTSNLNYDRPLPQNVQNTIKVALFDLIANKDTCIVNQPYLL